MANEILLVFHKGLNYDYYFIIEELAKEVEKQFGCSGEKTEKYNTFSIPIEKEVTNIYKDVMKVLSLYLTK